MNLKGFLILLEFLVNTTDFVQKTCICWVHFSIQFLDYFELFFEIFQGFFPLWLFLAGNSHIFINLRGGLAIFSYYLLISLKRSFKIFQGFWEFFQLKQVLSNIILRVGRRLTRLSQQFQPYFETRLVIFEGVLPLFLLIINEPYFRISNCKIELSIRKTFVDIFIFKVEFQGLIRLSFSKVYRSYIWINHSEIFWRRIQLLVDFLLQSELFERLVKLIEFVLNLAKKAISEGNFDVFFSKNALSDI